MPRDNTGGRLESFLGGSPVAILVKLALLSLLVGFVMHAVGLTPGDILSWAQSVLARLWREGWSILLSAGSWLIVGAVIVVPLFLVVRLFARKR
jgi:hypothetical protein